MSTTRKLILLFAVIMLVFTGLSGAIGFQIGKLIKVPQAPSDLSINQENIKVVNENSIVIDVVKKVSPSVVTIGIVKKQNVINPFSIDPFNPFGFFQNPPSQDQSSRKIEQDIGTGFIINSDGTIVTNKHVVADTEAKYKVVTKDDKTYDVQKIYRDPINDLAIIKINLSAGSGQVLEPVELGDSSKLEVGQFVIAIGTALGEFRNTVTTGVVSGLGRGITAGNPFEGSTEQLDNVIQTDAAINPGNSGGPLLNSAGQVIGVNAAVAEGAQNIGFALPINIIKESLKTFNETGKFSPKPYLGIKYKMISRDLALLNEVPEGAYVQDVIVGSPAEKAEIAAGDIITKIDGVKITEKDNDLAKTISGKKVGDTIEVTYFRDDKENKVSVKLGEQQQQ